LIATMHADQHLRSEAPVDYRHSKVTVDEDHSHVVGTL
jgi:hypothetical protein